MVQPGCGKARSSGQLIYAQSLPEFPSSSSSLVYGRAFALRASWVIMAFAAWIVLEGLVVLGRDGVADGWWGIVGNSGGAHGHPPPQTTAYLSQAKGHPSRMTTPQTTTMASRSMIWILWISKSVLKGKTNLAKRRWG